MICPHEPVEMQLVMAESHYGQTVIIDQCPKCGGIWFDKLELYAVKSGEANKIELLDTEALSTSTAIENPDLLCPRDRTRLVQFHDPCLPPGLIIERCPRCDGIWLNRGEFTKYQSFRQGLKRAREKSAEDTRFKQDMEQMLSQHDTGDSSEVLGRLGTFLSAPIDTHTLRPLEDNKRSSEEEETLGLVVNVLTVILNTLIHR
jgi:Zn-finger nucleic acid-binding protein